VGWIGTVVVYLDEDEMQALVETNHLLPLIDRSILEVSSEAAVRSYPVNVLAEISATL